ncbi:MAG: CbiQ family ECF transporter T component, partial [Oscillospiraceae bacterium]
FILVAITSVLQIFYNKSGDIWLQMGGFKVTSGGVYMAVFTTVRIALLVVSSSMLTYTTSPTLLTDAIE